MPLPNGQTTLDVRHSLPTRPVGPIVASQEGVDERNFSPDETIEEQDAEEAEFQSPTTNGQLVFEHYEPPNDSARRNESGDVDMG